MSGEELRNRVILRCLENMEDVLRDCWDHEDAAAYEREFGGDKATIMLVISGLIRELGGGQSSAQSSRIAVSVNGVGFEACGSPERVSESLHLFMGRFEDQRGVSFSFYSAPRQTTESLPPAELEAPEPEQRVDPPPATEQPEPAAVEKPATPPATLDGERDERPISEVATTEPRRTVEQPKPKPPERSGGSAGKPRHGRPILAAGSCRKCGLSFAGMTPQAAGAHKRYCKVTGAATPSPKPEARKQGPVQTPPPLRESRLAPSSSKPAYDGRLIERSLSPVRCPQCGGLTRMIRMYGDQIWTCPICCEDANADAAHPSGPTAPTKIEAKALGLNAPEVQ